MKILHLLHTGLPDTRVERAAQTGRKEGYNVCFAGPFVKGMNSPVDSFDRLYRVPFNKFGNVKIPSYWRVMKRKLSQILSEYRPDFVHAHNVVAAKLISEFPVPFIYDDHEYWSKQCELRRRIWKPERILIKWLWTRWEKEVLRKASATITVSETIAEEHKRLCSHVYVAPNFPSRIETESSEIGFDMNECLSSVYIGLADLSSSHVHKPVLHRNTEGFLELFRDDSVGTLTVIGDPELPSSRNVNSLGVLSHQTAMKELARHHLGLLPWKKHWYHKYCNPNKPYEYAHAGLLVLAVSDLPCVIQRLGDYCVTFNDFNELKEIMLSYADNLDGIRELRPKIRKFALKNLVWEKKCEPEILRAYSRI